jgi:hypothetical protein
MTVVESQTKFTDHLPDNYLSDGLNLIKAAIFIDMGKMLTRSACRHAIVSSLVKSDGFNWSFKD